MGERGRVPPLVIGLPGCLAARPTRWRDRSWSWADQPHGWSASISGSSRAHGPRFVALFGWAGVQAISGSCTSIAAPLGSRSSTPRGAPPRSSGRRAAVGAGGGRRGVLGLWAGFCLWSRAGRLRARPVRAARPRRRIAPRRSFAATSGRLGFAGSRGLASAASTRLPRTVRLASAARPRLPRGGRRGRRFSAAAARPSVCWVPDAISLTGMVCARAAAASVRASGLGGSAGCACPLAVAPPTLGNPRDVFLGPRAAAARRRALPRIGRPWLILGWRSKRGLPGGRACGRLVVGADDSDTGSARSTGDHCDGEDLGDGGAHEWRRDARPDAAPEG